jgi:hypothetical protein
MRISLVRQTSGRALFMSSGIAFETPIHRLARCQTAGALVFALILTACESQRDPTAPNPTSPAINPEPAPARVPADGNGNKAVFPVDDHLQVACRSGDILRADVTGWVQVRTFDQAGNRNVELNVFHLLITYTTAAGETFIWHDVGPDHYYLDNGNLIVAATGRSTGSGVIGHVLINLDTGVVEFTAGKEFGDIDELACATLT